MIYPKEIVELYDGQSSGPYHGGRYLSHAIYTLAPKGGVIALPSESKVSGQSLRKAGLSGEWTVGRCLRGKHAERYDEQSLCVSHAHASFKELLSVATALIQAYDLPEVLIKEATMGKVFKINV